MTVLAKSEGMLRLLRLIKQWGEPSKLFFTFFKQVNYNATTTTTTTTTMTTITATTTSIILCVHNMQYLKASSLHYLMMMAQFGLPLGMGLKRQLMYIIRVRLQWKWSPIGLHWAEAHGTIWKQLLVHLTRWKRERAQWIYTPIWMLTILPLTPAGFWQILCLSTDCSQEQVIQLTSAIPNGKAQQNILQQIDCWLLSLQSSL